jgi:hypothetical protein
MRCANFSFSTDETGSAASSHEMMDGKQRGGRRGDESMKIATSILGMVARQDLTMTKIALFILLLITAGAGCSSVISNSESFYRDIPRRPINWREYLTD